MRRLVMTAVLGLSILVHPRPAAADTIATGDWIRMLGSTGTLGGGAFSLDNLSTPGSPDFLTYCLQRTQYIDYAHPFRVGSISNYADDLPTNDPISDETAWIYSSFRGGLLTGVYGPDAIQAAIWFLEGEWMNNVANSADLRAAAANAVLAGYRNDGVQVLNLFNENGSRAQDQLTYTPVPEPTSLALMALGLLAAAYTLRRRRRAVR